MKKLLINILLVSSISFAQNSTIHKMIEKKIDHFSKTPVHSILLYIENENFKYIEGFGLIDGEENTVSKNSPFRIASSTKLFVATIILQLEEEGKLQLNDRVHCYLKEMDYLDFKNFHNLNGEKYSNEITIKQLLSHRSGLADIFTDKEESFFNILFQNPTKQYNPKKIIDLYHQFYLHNKPHFIPNRGWHYSDMNYVLLGLLIEKIDSTSLATSIRNRILTPLKMNDTYFEFYEKPMNQDKIIQQYVGSINFSKINTSFDWAGGGLVSTNENLAIYIKALFNLEIIKQESLEKMIDVEYTKENESRYGLGVYEFVINGDIFYGHFGFYGTFIGYCPKTKTTLSYSISQATPNFNSYQFIGDFLNLSK